MISVKEHAYAKINLYLDVLSKRDDGFHEVRTLMHTVSLCDDVTVNVRRSDKTSVRLSVVGFTRLPTDSRNLAVMAAERFLAATLISAEVDIRLVKRIPVAAGLAGGSSDAAAVLRAMNKAFKRPLTEKRLLAIAAELGSDVPYCLIGGTVLCYGRGELMDRLSEKLHLHLVVAVADEWVSTPMAYGELDKIYNDFKDARNDESQSLYDEVRASVSSGELMVSKLYNIFENAVFKTCSGAESIKSKMYELGATHALMSGSGPSVFGIFADKASAELAKEHLVNSGIRAHYAETV